MADENVGIQTQDVPKPDAVLADKGGAKPEPSQTTDATTVQGRPDPAKQTPGDDRRDRGVLADLQKERKTRQALEQRLREQETVLAEERRRIQALAGVAPKTQDEVDAEEVRAQFAQLYPDLAGLTPEEIQEFRESIADRRALQETTKHYWKTHGQAMINKVVSAVATELGGENSELTDRQKKNLVAAYVRAAEESVAVDPRTGEMVGDGAFMQRHEAGDEGLIREFAKAWIDDWFEPARRKVTANMVNRADRRVPSGRAGGPVTSGKPKVDFKNEKAVEDAAVTAFLEHGGSFSN